MRQDMRRSMVIIFALVFPLCPLPASAGIMRDASLPLLLRLNSVLSQYLDTEASSEDCGALYCPACGEYHSRSAEAVLPFAYEASLTGSGERSAQAVGLGEWLVCAQNGDGSWFENSQTGWTGTTVDQLLALTMSYPLLKDHLSGPQRHRWRVAMRKAADYLIRVMDNRFAYINYCATASAALAHCYELFGSRRYLEKAETLAHLCVSNMNTDLLLEGEGDNCGDRKTGVDIAYNMEMSLWGLADYAVRTGDVPVADMVRRSAGEHLHFLYPDGTLDASAGLRSSKWILCGGSTSDGCFPLFAILAGADPKYASAAVRNVMKIGDCITSSGLVGSGTDYDSVRDTLPCIYHTFTKAKSLAMGLMFAENDPEKAVGIPSDADGVSLFTTIGTAVIRHGHFRGTICASRYCSKKGTDSKFMHRPSGGAMTALWAEGFGMLQLSSQNEYHMWESSFKPMPDVHTITPHIESPDGRFSMLYEYGSELSVSGDYSCSVCGELKDRDRISSGTGYEVTYEFAGDSLCKRYRVSGGEACLIEPVVIDEDTEVRRVDGHTVSITRGGALVTVTSGCFPLEIGWEDASNYVQLFPAVRTLPLKVSSIPDGGEVSIVFKVVER